MMLTALVTSNAEGPKVSSSSMLRLMVAGPPAVNAGSKTMVSLVPNGWVWLIWASCCADRFRPVVLPVLTTRSASRRVKTLLDPVGLSCRLLTVSTAGAVRSSSTSRHGRTRRTGARRMARRPNQRR